MIFERLDYYYHNCVRFTGIEKKQKTKHSLYKSSLLGSSDLDQLFLVALFFVVIHLDDDIIVVVAPLELRRAANGPFFVPRNNERAAVSIRMAVKSYVRTKEKSKSPFAVYWNISILQKSRANI